VATCEATFAVNEALAARIARLGDVGVEVVRNGVRAGIEAAGLLISRPPLPAGEMTVGYFGHLAGAWFDWGLVAAAARARPSWRFYLIGYGGAPEGVELPGNVHLLGRRLQHELASLAASWDVAIVPFKPGRLAASADPIKTYEYLAMGLPVVTTGVDAPPGAEAFVTRADSPGRFLDALTAAAARPRAEATARRAFAATCTWDARIDAILSRVAASRARRG
jgi:glycosyltransferase involved in cell wall biosynthesis